MEDKRRPRCIICNEQKEGLEVAPDSFIRTLRWLNSHTIKHKNPYRPVVCRECFVKYRKMRKSFERKRIAYIVIGVLFAAVLATSLKPLAVLAGLGVIAFMYLLSLVNYMPALRVQQAARREARNR